MFVGAAAKGMKGALVISNIKDQKVHAYLDLKGIATDDVQILVTDRFNRYTLTGRDLSQMPFVLSPHSCTEIKFLDPQSNF